MVWAQLKPKAPAVRTRKPGTLAQGWLVPGPRGLPTSLFPAAGGKEAQLGTGMLNSSLPKVNRGERTCYSELTSTSGFLVPITCHARCRWGPPEENKAQPPRQCGSPLCGLCHPTLARAPLRTPTSFKDYREILMLVGSWPSPASGFWFASLCV